MNLSYDNHIPLVSIILPNYNHSLYLRERIDSILNQTFQDFELIILDDCSTDNSIDIIKAYLPSDKITQTVFNEQNSGSTFLQWKKGFSLAQGKYIWIAESDDYADITFLEKLVPLLDGNDKCNIVVSRSYLVDNKSNIICKDWIRMRDKSSLINKYNGHTFVKAQLFNNTIFNSGMALFRKSALDNIDDRYASFRYSGDYFFWNKIALQGDVIRHGERLSYFRQHATNVTSKAASEGFGAMENRYIIDDLMNSLGLNTLQRKVVIGRFIDLIVSSPDYKTAEIKEQILKEIKDYFKCGMSSLYFYKADKRLNFSSLDVRRNKCI